MDNELLSVSEFAKATGVDGGRENAKGNRDTAGAGTQELLETVARKIRKAPSEKTVLRLLI